MLKQIQVALVDDDADFSEAFQRRFLEVWTEKYPDVNVDFRFLEGPEEGLAYLREDSARPDVLVSEVNFASTPAQLSGDLHVRTDLIRAAVEKQVPIAVIVAGGEEPKHSFVERCKEAGAADVLWKEDFREGDSAFFRLCNIIYGGLVEAGLIEHIRVSCTRGDLLAKSVVAVVGSGVISWLYSQLFSQVSPEELRVKFIAQGGSGAYVLYLEARGPATRQHIVMKLSRNEVLLRGEIEGQPELGEIAPVLFSRCEPTNPDDIPVSKGWYAIALSFASDAVTLRAWLSAGASDDRVRAVLEALFLRNGLAALSAVGVKRNDACSVVAVLRPSLESRARFAREVSALQAVIGDYAGLDTEGFTEALDRVDGFLNSEQVGATESPTRVIRARCHGDLHAGNILIHGSEAPPRVIDMDGKHRHWAVDVARLSVDLILTCYDGQIASYQWESLDRWQKLLVAVANRDSGALPVDVDDAGNHAVAVAVSWLLDNLGEVCPVVQTELSSFRAEWEFRAAVCMELLYSVSRTDITAPKRVSSFLAARQVLIELESALREDARRAGGE